MFLEHPGVGSCGGGGVCGSRVAAAVDGKYLEWVISVMVSRDYAVLSGWRSVGLVSVHVPSYGVRKKRDLSHFITRISPTLVEVAPTLAPAGSTLVEVAPTSIRR